MRAICSVVTAILLASSAHGTGAASAQDYPARPIKIIVPFPPGGGVDTSARLIANEMTKTFRQSVVIENRPGAAGTTGAAAAARSEPDGYTIVNLPGGHPLYGAIYKSLPFDPVNSFDFISTLVTLQFVFVVKGDSKIRSLAQLVAEARASPQSMTFGSAGAGSTHHLTGELLGVRTGTKFLHVPFQGEALAMNALLGGQIAFSLATPTQIVGNIDAGTVRVLAVTGNTRWKKLPDVPTAQEALGIEDFDVRTWFGMAGPAGMPRPIVETLNGEIRRALTVAEVRDRLEKIGGEIAPSAPQEFRDRVARELRMWNRIVDDVKFPKL